MGWNLQFCEVDLDHHYTGGKKEDTITDLVTVTSTHPNTSMDWKVYCQYDHDEDGVRTPQLMDSGELTTDGNGDASFDFEFSCIEDGTPVPHLEEYDLTACVFNPGEELPTLPVSCSPTKVNHVEPGQGG